jgi:hypothetical protein
MKVIKRVTGSCLDCGKRTQGKTNTNEFICRKCKHLRDTNSRISYLNSISLFDQGWIVGMIEGEGCFYKKTSASNLKSGTYCYPMAGFALMSTDKDVMVKFANILQLDLRGPYYTRSKQERKEVWSTQVTGYKAVIIMEHFYKYFGERRKSQIDSALEWNNLNRFEVTCRTVG